MKYKKQDVLAIPKKPQVVKAIKELADEKLSHLFTLTEQDINRVLLALSYYCEHKGAKATKKIYERNLLQMFQYEDGACGHRFEMWAM